MSERTTTLIGQWLVRLEQGDASARNEILRHSERRLRLLTRKMFHGYPALQAAIETDDVLIEVLDRLNRTLENIPVDSPRGFFALATNHLRFALIDLWRKHVPRNDPRVLPAAPDSPSPLDTVPDGRPHEPARLACWSEVHEWIAALPDDLKAVFDLLWYQGLTQNEAASVLGVPKRTVTWRWQRARLRFRDHFGEPFQM